MRSQKRELWHLPRRWEGQEQSMLLGTSEDLNKRSSLLFTPVDQGLISDRSIPLSHCGGALLPFLFKREPVLGVQFADRLPLSWLQEPPQPRPTMKCQSQTAGPEKLLYGCHCTRVLSWAGWHSQRCIPESLSLWYSSFLFRDQNCAAVRFSRPIPLLSPLSLPRALLPNQFSEPQLCLQ